jgi:hypothetical protein
MEITAHLAGCSSGLGTQGRVVSSSFPTSNDGTQEHLDTLQVSALICLSIERGVATDLMIVHLELLFRQERLDWDAVRLDGPTRSPRVEFSQDSFDFR